MGAEVSSFAFLYDGNAENGRAPNIGRRLTRAELLDAARNPIEWTLDGLAARGYLTVLAGRGGEGKSLFMLAAASAAQAGQHVGGITTQAGGVAAWDAENGVELLGRRLLLLGPDAEWPTYYDAAGVHLRTDIDALADEIEERDYRMVIFDSLRTLAPDVEENSSDSLGPVIVAVRDLARRTRAAVVLIVHRDKALAHNYRGSAVLHDQADLLFVLEREDNDPLARHRRRLRCAKARICEEPPPRWITLRHHHDRLTIHEAEPYEPDPEGRPATVRDSLGDDALRVLREAGERLSRSEIARRLGRAETDRTTRRALDELEEQGVVDRDDKDGGWGLVPPSAPPTKHPARSPLASGGWHPVGVPPGDNPATNPLGTPTKPPSEPDPEDTP